MTTNSWKLAMPVMFFSIAGCLWITETACTPAQAEVQHAKAKLPSFTWLSKGGVYYLVVEHNVRAKIGLDSGKVGFYELMTDGGTLISRWDDLKAAQHVAELIFVHELSMNAPCSMPDTFVPLEPESQRLFPKASEKPGKRI